MTVLLSIVKAAAKGVGIRLPGVRASKLVDGAGGAESNLRRGGRRKEET